MLRSLAVLALAVSAAACVDRFDDTPPAFMPVTTGPETITSDDGIDSMPDASGGGSCSPGAQGCPCVLGQVCKSGLVCSDGLCIPCTDCAECGNNSCDVAQGESCASCPADCGACESCGNDLCEPELAEDCASCPADCDACESCGNGSCEADQGEDCFSCEPDCDACPPACGDGDCNGGETCALCPGDCDCPPPPPGDPCSGFGNGWWCGQTLGGTPNVLYYCVGGLTSSSQPCAYGCALCPVGTADECKSYAGQSDADACNPAECTAGDQSACSEYETCVGGSCTSCGSGTANCDGSGGCECAGYCGNGGFCCTEFNCAIQPQCLIC
ncbi:MAG: hypothetical protein H6712_30980 [Myxococcales bacterium]|nr:hypothetical protein [Myxococcales bacterium]MCB9718316.1 hypothetical protein [Myxococcales bacterium]